MTKTQMTTSLIKIDQAENNGEVYVAGEYKGQNIKTRINGLSLEQLKLELSQYMG